jgi:hypothetical protein
MPPMGRKQGTFYLGLATCVVVAAGLYLSLRQSSASQAPTPSVHATPAPSAKPSPVATDVPAPNGTIGSIAWQAGAPLGLGVRGVAEIVLSMCDRLLAFGNIGADLDRGNYGLAAVWSSSDAATWSLLTQPNTFPSDSAFFLDVTEDGRGGLYAITARYEGAKPNALWHSPDGVTWTRLTVGRSQVLTNATIAVANGTAVVTGQTRESGQPRRYVWYSIDGLTWTQAALPEAYPDEYGAALMVGGSGGFEIVEPTGLATAWHSDDGRTWLKAESPGGTFAAFVPTHLLTSAGRYVAMGYESGNAGVPSAWTSADGVAWSRSSMEDPGPAFGCATGCQPTAVTRVGNALVAVGYRTQDRATLPASAPIATWVSTDDGRTWLARGGGSPGVLPMALAALGSDVVVFGRQLPVVETANSFGFGRSARGSITWQAVESPTSAEPSIEPTWSTTPSTAPSVKTGPIEFRQATEPKAPAEAWQNLVSYVNGHFYNVFDRWTVSGTPRRGPALWESDDGTAWHQIANEAQFNGKGKQDCAFIAALTDDGQGGLVAVGSVDSSCAGAVTGTAAVWQSNDGTTWRRATLQTPLTGVLWHVASAGANLVAIGEDGQELYSADHGRTWQTGSLNGRGGLMTLASWQGGFIAGDGAHAWRSSDGQAWVALGPAPPGATAVGGVFVGALNSLYWSSDGATWTVADGPTTESFDPRAIAGDGEIAVAVDVHNEMWITSDGKTWRDTGKKLVVSTSDLHSGVPVFCIGAGRLVTIVAGGNSTQAFYADLVE